MKAKITVAWIGVALVLGAIVILILKGTDFFAPAPAPAPVEEPFINPADHEYSEDLSLTSCPADSKQYVDSGGHSVCCNGEAVGGKCIGTQICSLSESFGGLPTCGEWLGAYLADKGRNRCPSSMPHYFENKKTGVKGCTAGNRTKDGTAPAASTNKQCKLYNGKDDDLLKMDSCSNQIIFENTNCFSRNVNGTTKQFIDGRGFMPPSINCSVMDINSFVAGNCVEQTSFARSMDYIIDKYFPHAKQWKDNSYSWPPQYKLTFCSVMQKLNFDKTIEFDDLKKVSVF
jgi:hypothetical protein